MTHKQNSRYAPCMNKRIQAWLAGVMATYERGRTSDYRAVARRRARANGWPVYCYRRPWYRSVKALEYAKRKAEYARRNQKSAAIWNTFGG